MLPAEGNTSIFPYFPVTLHKNPRDTPLAPGVIAPQSIAHLHGNRAQSLQILTPQTHPLGWEGIAEMISQFFFL